MKGYLDGLTWLSDAMRGEAVQVNPVTGKQENRLKVAPAVEVLLNKEQLYVVDRVRAWGAIVRASRSSSPAGSTSGARTR